MTPNEVLFDAPDGPFALDLAPLDPDLLDAPDELFDVVRASAARHADAMQDRRNIEFLVEVLRDELPDATWDVLVEALDTIATRHERLLVAVVADVLAAWSSSREDSKRSP